MTRSVAEHTEAVRTASPPVLPPALLSTRHAAQYLDVSVRWLQSECDVRPIDVRAPGSRKPMPRYRREDLDDFIRRRYLLTTERTTERSRKGAA